MPPTRLPLLASLLVACATPIGGSRWIEVETPHFRLVSGAGGAQTREIAEHLELFRAFLGTVAPNTNLEPRVPLLVYVFGDSREYARFRPRSAVTGFMLPRTERNFLVIDAGGESDVRAIALHEYVHFFLRNGKAMHYPPWYDEGFAEMLSTLVIEDQHVIVGAIPEARRTWLEVGSPISLRRLMTAEDPYEWSNRALARFYAQAWATVHFFYVGNRVGFPDRQSQMLRYLQLVDAGLDADAACEQSFGSSFERLEEEFLDYLSNGKLAYLGWRRDRLHVPPAGTARDLPDYERDQLLGELALAMGGKWLPEAENWFRLALESRPDSARARVALGRVLAVSDPAGSDGLLEAAIAATPDDAMVQRVYGEALLERAIAGRADMDRLIERSRRAFRRSLALDPGQVAALALLGRSYVEVASPGGVEEGLAALRTAHERLPADRDIALALAQLELAAGADARAQEILIHMPPPSHGDPTLPDQRRLIADTRRSAGLPPETPESTRHLEARLAVDSPLDGHQVRGLLGWIGVSGAGGLWEATLHDVVIAIDESASTLVPTGSDLDGDGEVGRPRAGHDRDPDGRSSDPGDIVIRAELEAARALIRQLDPTTTRVGVVTFAGLASVLAPLGTPESASGALELYETRVDSTGTSLAAALGKSLEEFFASREAGVRRQRTILLLSDGQPTAPSERRAKHDALELATRLGDAGVAVHAFALGEQALEEPEFYRSLAEQSGGKFVAVENPADVVDQLASVRFTGLQSIEIWSSPADQAGRAIRVLPDGSFDGYAPLVEGANRLTITAHMDGGRTLVEEIEVSFEQPADPGDDDRLQAERLREELETRAIELELHAEIVRRRSESATREIEVEVERGADAPAPEP